MKTMWQKFLGWLNSLLSTTREIDTGEFSASDFPFDVKM